MKTEFRAAIAQLSAERKLPKEVVLAALESALVSAYKREVATPDLDVAVKVDPNAGEINFYVQKVVAEPVTNPDREISLEEALRLRSTAQLGEIVSIESTPKNIGRIAVQAAKQVVLQRLREAEHRIIYEELSDRAGKLVTGIVQYAEPKKIYLRLNRTEAILPANEQVPNEHYYRGQRLKLYLLDIAHGGKEPQIIVSRSHPNLIRRLFELEIPEVHSGIVELKAIAREAGHRTKVAVASAQESIDPVGCCLGPRGIRLQSIINELNGEKIDVIQWHSDPGVFISNALSPAQVANIRISEERNTATVVVPDKQLSLAIGKEGQNARLAAKLTGWRIDIKSVSAVEVERTLRQGPEPVAEAMAPDLAEIALTEAAPVEEAILEGPVEFPPLTEAPVERTAEEHIRFAEDILLAATKPKATDKDKGGAKGKRKAKVIKYRERDDSLVDDDIEE
jgi:transcription termination/antitermination protein NusA